MPAETCQMLHTNALFKEYTDRYGQEQTLAQLKQYHEDTDSILMKPAMLNHLALFGLDKTMTILCGCLSMVWLFVMSIHIDTITKLMEHEKDYYNTNRI